MKPMKLTEKLLINKKYFEVQVTITTEPDEGHEFDEEEELPLEGTEVQVVIVKTELFNESGYDILGGCYISSNEDIFTAISENSMIEESLNDLKNRILAKQLLLNKMLGENS